ncbi:hypothetical protein PWG15_21185 (plasmid) [Ensifer adhaerens]|uniref:hypothetical protein n=1 Tax=Ensifer adhaerens TaxID=106592 RepID=UPI0023A9C971|nr:hypothetical protein [Ensifer adhaerens]WDZ80311.1 hypothetical protein PWG15_21185 [Ensifer adhaerens]
MSSRLETYIALALSLSIVAPAAAHAESSFLDHRGKKITFAKPPERVVTIVRSAPIIYRAVDEKADSIVGMNKDSLTRYFTKGIYAEMLPEMADQRQCGTGRLRAKCGGDPGREAGCRYPVDP